MSEPLFIDVGPLCCAATDDALEAMYKSTHDHDDGIWNPHESILIRRLIELFSQRGLDRLEHVKQQMLAWESGAYYKETAAKVTPPGMMGRWNEHELGLVRIYLESLFPGDWTLDDHMLAIEYVVNRYLPEDALKTEAEWLSTKAAMMGKVQANMAKQATAKQADAILAALPGTMAEAFVTFSLKAQEKAALDFARVRTAENVRAVSELVRHRLRATIVQHLEEQQSTAAVGGQALEQKLFDQFGTLNRDWRRIAVTEAGEAQNQGYIASLQPGTKVKRVEVYRNACGFCKKIHDKVVTVVAANHPDKDPDTMIWPGKNNIGRSASPRKRVGNVLVMREPSEMWTVPAGLVHPHCRGRWVPVIEDAPGDDKDFGDWLRAHLS